MKRTRPYLGTLRRYANAAALPFPVPEIGWALDEGTGQIALINSGYWKEGATAVAPTPTVISLDVDNGPVGTEVVITGTKFIAGSVPSFNGTVATVFSVDSATQITADVPTGATTGEVTVDNGSGLVSSGGPDFTVEAGDAPVIESMDISSGGPDTVVELTGTGFDTVTDIDLLTPQVHSCDFEIVDPTHINVTIPDGPNNGPFLFRATNPAGTGDSPTAFTVENFTDIWSGSSGAFDLSSGERDQLVDGSGDMQYELGFVVDRTDNQADIGDFLGGLTAGQLTTLYSGDHYTDRQYVGELGGNLGSVCPIGFSRVGNYITLESYHRFTAGGAGLHTRINGCRLEPKPASGLFQPSTYSPSAAVSAFSAAHVFTRDGSTQPQTGFTAKKLRKRTNDPRPVRAEGAILGDSILAENDASPAGTAEQQAAVGTLIYASLAQIQSRAGIWSFAAQGHKVSDQKALWVASDFHNDAATGAQLAWVLIQVGVNNFILNDDSAAFVISELEDLRDTIAADAPNAAILIGTITPCDQYLASLNAAYPGRRATVNAAITGSITGITPVDNEASMEDSGNPGYLDPSLEADNMGNADHIHDNLAGRVINAGNFVAALQSLGLLP